MTTRPVRAERAGEDRRVAKTIVYLDHNFVSNLAKARLGRIRDAGQQEYYAQLFELLESLVLKDRIICPRSTFHNIEAEFDERLETEIRLTIAALAREMRFLDDTEVLNNQATKALYKYLGKDPLKPFAPWAEAFAGDPEAPILRDLPVIDVKIPVFGRSRESRRRAKKLYVQEISVVRQRRLERPLSFDAQLRRQRLSFVRSCYFLPFLRWVGARAALARGLKWDLSALSVAGRVFHLERHYADVTADERYALDSPFWDFFLSDEFGHVPYVDIYCSPHAGSLACSPGRRPQEGDLFDVAAMATVLPYSDILATDGYMKSLIQGLGLDVKYGAEVFSARKADLPTFLSRLTPLSGVETATIIAGKSIPKRAAARGGAP